MRVNFYRTKAPRAYDYPGITVELDAANEAGMRTVAIKADREEEQLARYASGLYGATSLEGTENDRFSLPALEERLWDLVIRGAVARDEEVVR